MYPIFAGFMPLGGVVGAVCAPLRELRREVCVYLSVGGVVWCEVVGFFAELCFQSQGIRQGLVF